MYILESYPLAVVLLIITMLCWGSWPNMFKLTKDDWRFELFYWDYVLGILLLSLIFSFTLGSFGENGRNFIADISQAETTHISSALIGGVIFNLANILFMAAIALAGMSVAFPIGGGIALILGVSVNYLGDPVGNPLYLFTGVGFIMAAIILSASTSNRLSTQLQNFSYKGILLAVVAGILFAVFYRFIASSMAADFARPEEGKLTPYSAVFVFGIGVLLSNFIFNTFLMKKPIEGIPVSYSDYFNGSFRNHAMGILGGATWGLGLSLSIISAGQAGFAISWGLSQGNAMIAAIWGVFIWKEFKDAPSGTNRLIGFMFFCYLAGLLAIILSRLV
ncbi:MAG TPA: multidrug DMT transporter permease [Flavobacteriales bacterium]|nr:multidrug DMT transporter permease [Flavobacteriales bacterium]HIO67074.1 multidrug DMT transporter permease [Flavobacteriales bacterium]